MIFDISQLRIEVIKKFDGNINYYNPSHFNGRTIFRRESKFEDKLLVSDVVDDQDNVILQHVSDDNLLLSYEDARFVNENEISLCCCRRYKDNLNKIINVEYKKYNLLTKEFTHFKTQNAHFEKHWQFYEDKIIYHVNPYTILDNNENVIFKKQINWTPWIEKYGNPGLSTNIFNVDGKKYILFHSYNNKNGINLKYHCGLLLLDDDLNPFAYTIDSLFPSFDGYDVLNYKSYFNWKRTISLACPTIVDVVFPMNVTVDDDNVTMYAGINDFICGRIKIEKNLFIESVNKAPYILI